MAMSKRIVIVGASAAGLRCACRLKRLQPDWPVTVVEARDLFSYGACGMPYVVSGDIDTIGQLRTTAWGVDRDEAFFADVKGVEVLAGHRALEVLPDRRLLVEGPDGPRQLVFDELVIATGATPRRLPDQPDDPKVRTFHVLEDVKPLKMGLMQGEIDHVALIGAGLVGCELAEAFRSMWGAEVTLFEAGPHILPDVLDAEVAAVAEQHLREQGVTLHTGQPVVGLEADDEGVTVRTADLELRADAAVVAIGVEPSVGLATALGAVVGATGALRVSPDLRTSVESVWAVGDCVECVHAVTGQGVHLPLGSLANRQGRVAADVLAGRRGAFPPVAGAMAVKVFERSVAAVGASAGRLERLGRPHRTAWVSVEDAAHYWPEAEELHLALVYDPEDRRVLGLQAIGGKWAVSRVDAATPFITRGATLDDLMALEHAYAPPFAGALDPVAIAAFVAANQEDGIASISPTASMDGVTVLDVRTDDEAAANAVDVAAKHIELSEVRQRESEVPDGDLLVVCARGTRSAEAARWLARNGRELRYLGGGLRWRRAAGIIAGE
jgi:NADPH-dependent 2,4-dienoyl-CoA reductase/sulfur reductase-like enzyme/rhodanese-related sulfurtransferase